MSLHLCSACGACLSGDEIALHKKLFGLAQSSYRCLECQSQYLNTTCVRLEQVIAYYHRRGSCALFAKWEEEAP